MPSADDADTPKFGGHKPPEYPGTADADWLSDEESERRQIIVTREAPRRIDIYLFTRIGTLSRSRVKRLIEIGGITLNGKPTKPSAKIAEGDVIDVVMPPPTSRDIKPEPIPLDVVYEDEHMIVLNKQADLIVHPARGNTSGTLVNGLAYYFTTGHNPINGQALPQSETNAPAPSAEPNKAGKLSGENAVQTAPEAGPPSGGSVTADDDRGEDEGPIVEGLSTVGASDYRPGIVHRLDRYTTGVMVVAKSDEAHWPIAQQFADRTNLKAYLAVVHGNIDTPSGVIEQPLGKHPTIREAYAVRHDSTSRHALTIYRVREQYQGYSLVELELKTGRTHQIRVHLSHMGYPIVGDLVYGGEPVGAAELDNPPIAAGSRKLLTYARDKAEGQRMEYNALKRDDILLTHPALHACLLGIWHPILEKQMRFTAPLHDPMLTLVHELRKRPAEGPIAPGGTHIDLEKAVPASSEK